MFGTSKLRLGLLWTARQMLNAMPPAHDALVIVVVSWKTQHSSGLAVEPNLVLLEFFLFCFFVFIVFADDGAEVVRGWRGGGGNGAGGRCWWEEIEGGYAALIGDMRSGAVSEQEAGDSDIVVCACKVKGCRSRIEQRFCRMWWS